MIFKVVDIFENKKEEAVGQSKKSYYHSLFEGVVEI